MNIINATVLRNNLSDSLNEVIKKKGYLLIARKKKIVSALVDIELFEDLVALSNNKYLKSINKSREEYKKGDVFIHDEVFGEI